LVDKCKTKKRNIRRNGKGKEGKERDRGQEDKGKQHAKARHDGKGKEREY